MTLIGVIMGEFLGNWMSLVYFVGLIFISIGMRKTFKSMTTLQKIGFALLWVGILFSIVPSFVDGFVDGFLDGMQN